ncbi:hypothetical protein Fmac_011623 [Flemingia macrophylla]|uniref:Uncharacterized protein n=1 Tax=Flemingia macrophylla TaxID=520843 RepID=A0ABD1MN00_9FABA
MTQEEKFMDEDVFLDKTLFSTNEESLILHDIKQCQSLATYLSKWTYPTLHADYVSQSCSIGHKLSYQPLVSTYNTNSSPTTHLATTNEFTEPVQQIRQSRPQQLSKCRADQLLETYNETLRGHSPLAPIKQCITRRLKMN